MPPGNWNDTTDRQLLLVMLHLTAPQLPKWDKVAELMGDRFTAEAVRQHFQKLRKTSVAQFGPLGGGSNSNTSTPATTPRKSKAKGGSETPSKSAGKRKNMSSTDLGNDDDDEEASPVKKQAVEVKKEEGLDLDFLA